MLSASRLATRKRKTSPVLIDKNANDITKCKNFFKANKGMTLCSELVSLRVKSRTKLSRKEMTAILDIMEYNSTYSEEFASDQCPAGGDVPWLAARDAREELEEEYLTVENESTAAKTPTFDPEAVLQKIIDFNKEHVNQLKKREKRSTSKPSRYSPSEDEPEIPVPNNEHMFEFSEAMQHLDGAKSRNTYIKFWVSVGWIPVKQSTCARLWKLHNDYKRTGKGKPPKGWKVISGRPQLASTADFVEACEAIEKDAHMSLSKEDISQVLFDLSKKKSEASNEWKSDRQHTPSRQSVDRYFALCCDRRSKKLRHGKVQKKTMTRFTGEHSLRSAASFAGVEASIGLIVGEDDRPTRLRSQSRMPVKALRNLSMSFMRQMMENWSILFNLGCSLRLMTRLPLVLKV